jgi:phage-related protein
MISQTCKYKVKQKDCEYTCGSYAFNLHKEGINQGDYCDRHYWEARARRAEEYIAHHYSPSEETKV